MDKKGRSIPYRARVTERRTVPYIQVLVKIPERLGPALDEEANRFSISRTRWITALVEHRLAGSLQLPWEAELAIIQVRSELRRLRMGLASPHVQPAQRDAALLEEVDDRLRAAMAQIEAAFAQSGRYWRGG